jgi:type II secretory pathway component PulF
MAWFPFWSARKLSLRVQGDMMEDLADLLNDEIPIAKAVNELAGTYRGRASEAARMMEHALRHGQDVSDAMRGYFSAPICDAYRSGVRSGRAAESITYAVAMCRNQGAAVGRLMGALSYPMVVLFAAMTAIVIMATQVLPEVATMVPRNRWTPLTAAVFGTGNFITHYGIFVLLGVGCAVGWIVWSLPNLTGELRHTLDRYPPWSLYRRYQSAFFLQTLSLLLRSEIPIKDALSLTASRSTSYMQGHLQQMLMKLASPSNDGAMSALDTGLIPDQDMRRIRLRGQSGNVEEALHKSGERSAQDVLKVIDLTGRFLNYTILLIAGGLVAFMGMGFFEALSRIGI